MLKLCTLRICICEKKHRGRIRVEKKMATNSPYQRSETELPSFAENENFQTNDAVPRTPRGVSTIAVGSIDNDETSANEIHMFNTVIHEVANVVPGGAPLAGISDETITQIGDTVETVARSAGIQITSHQKNGIAVALAVLLSLAGVYLIPFLISKIAH